MSPETFADRSNTKEKQLEAGTWGVFFLWLGISFLAHVPWSVWLLGVGAIVLVAQLARRMSALEVDLFWVVAGGLFVLGGISEIAPFGISIAVIPALCIAAGIGLVAKALTRRAGPRHAS